MAPAAEKLHADAKLVHVEAWYWSRTMSWVSNPGRVGPYPSCGESFETYTWMSPLSRWSHRCL